jgi:hypothetical protein
LYQASAPSASNASSDAGVDLGSRSRKSASSGFAPFFTKQVSGTPQARWRDSTQSGRASIIERRRFARSGVQVTSSSIEVSARSRIVVPWRPCRRRGAVDGGEPLRRVAVDHRRLGAPGMRVGMLDLAARQQLADLDQLVDHGALLASLLALVA